ncbi:MAG TPA: MBL fold metallo-hydrolase [Thermoanaerobaculia bacterium]
MPHTLRFVIAALIALPLFADTAYTVERTVTKLADGVYAIRHEDPLPGWANGNTTVIIGSRDVFVVDSGQFPSVAREDIAQIRQWTDKPVRYLLNTHWHLDHAGGNAAYMEAFPGLAVVAHAQTKEMLDNEVQFMLGGMPATIHDSQQQAEKALRSGKVDDRPLSDAGRKMRERGLARSATLLDDVKNFVYQPPTLTFRDELTIDLGGREVQVKFLGRGNTGGDAVVYLPKEKILATGDLVVHPIPYMFDGYPVEWSSTLDRLAALDTETIVPGHGDVMHDKKYIFQLRDLMRSVVRQVEAQLRTNFEMPLDDVKKAIDVKQQRDEILAGDTAEAGFFDYSLSEFIGYAYHEAKQR